MDATLKVFLRQCYHQSQAIDEASLKAIHWGLDSIHTFLEKEPSFDSYRIDGASKLIGERVKIPEIMDPEETTKATEATEALEVIWMFASTYSVEVFFSSIGNHIEIMQMDMCVPSPYRWDIDKKMWKVLIPCQFISHN